MAERSYPGKFEVDLSISFLCSKRSTHRSRTRNSSSWNAERFSSVHLRFARWLSIQASDFDEAVVEVNGNEIWRNDPVGPLVDPACVDPFGADSTYMSDAEDMPEGAAGWKLLEFDISAVADHQDRVGAPSQAGPRLLCRASRSVFLRQTRRLLHLRRRRPQPRG